MARVHTTVAAQRLVTLLGPGGSGKTRLATDVARAGAGRAHMGAICDTVHLLPLLDVRTPEQFNDALRAGLRLAAGSVLLASIAARLDGQRTLLVLDNVEQLVDGCQGPVARPVARLVARLVARPIARLVAELPALHLLVTSRRALALDGEVLIDVAPLGVPGPGTHLSLRDAALHKGPTTRQRCSKAPTCRADA